MLICRYAVVGICIGSRFLMLTVLLFMFLGCDRIVLINSKWFVFSVLSLLHNEYRFENCFTYLFRVQLVNVGWLQQCCGSDIPRVLGYFIFIISYGIRLYTRICWSCDINNSYCRSAAAYLFVYIKKNRSHRVIYRREDKFNVIVDIYVCFRIIPDTKKFYGKKIGIYFLI